MYFWPPKVVGAIIKFKLDALTPAFPKLQNPNLRMNVLFIGCNNFDEQTYSKTKTRKIFLRPLSTFQNDTFDANKL